MEGERIKICKNFHMLLAEKYGWKIVNANRNIDEVKNDIKKTNEEVLK